MLYRASCFASVTDLKKFTGFGGVIASRSSPFESFLMSSMTDESPPVSGESDLDNLLVVVIYDITEKPFTNKLAKHFSKKYGNKG